MIMHSYESLAKSMMGGEYLTGSVNSCSTIEGMRLINSPKCLIEVDQSVKHNHIKTRE